MLNGLRQMATCGRPVFVCLLSQKGHAGSQVAPQLIRALQFYEIEDRLGWITGDNHGTNDTLSREIEEHLSNEV